MTDNHKILREEIRDLKSRHLVEIALVHATYQMALSGSPEGTPDIYVQIAMVKESDLFDEPWYRQAYPDIVEGGIDPAEHYVRAGSFEGRNPGPEFDTMGYYFANPHAAKEGWPALVHYIETLRQSQT
ncbi:MAG: hypothetical protein MK104_12420 [Erythrobacter sp.]|jgi:hypothetical protein|uniref:hypothetical protein n=1 Tax=Qipengyuania pacifica TaxID=2860199 RepID=UPI0035C78DB5|nr:hypothetical protein [Erythrobacter sp.]